SARHIWEASAKFGIDRRVGNDGEPSARDPTPRMFTEKIPISLVTPMNRHRRIGHDRFRSSGCDLQKSPRLFHDLITDIVETSPLRLGDDFLVGQGSLRSRIPVDHPATAINQAFAIKIDKNL